MRLIPTDEHFYTLLEGLASHVTAAASLLEDLFAVPDRASALIGEVKMVEYEADAIALEIVTRIDRSFITPFDREDIYLLSSALDDIVDLIDDIARAFVMYNVNQATDYARQFGDVIQRMAVQLHEVVSTLEKPAGIAPRLVEIHRLENEGDDLYHEAIGELFRGTPDPLRVIRWKDIYDKLEAAVDRCEQAANIIETVIIKHA